MIKNYISAYLEEVKTICDSVCVEDIVKFSEIVKNIKANRGRLFFLGVGGSSGNASHAVNDFRKILGIESYSVSTMFRNLPPELMMMDGIPHIPIGSKFPIYPKRCHCRIFSWWRIGYHIAEPCAFC